METKINKLLEQMTLEEKIGQMQQISSNLEQEIVEEFKNKGIIGSFLHVLGKDTKQYTEPAEKSRLSILPIFGIDAIHGHALLKEATVFPSQLAMACSFDEELVEKVGEITADEVAADNLNWVFSPVLCLGRDLRWGRIDETFGEDPTLVGKLGAAMIKGYQKNGMIAACAKHYLGYGEATGGRDSYDSEFTERKAREVFLKPFKEAVEAGCMTFMTAYGSVDGTPLTTSHRYLTEILREELGFEGFVVTDWKNLENLVFGQNVAEDFEEASIEAVLAGNDMMMNSQQFFDAAIRMVKEGRLSESAVDEAVRRILRVKARLGLLEADQKVRPAYSVIGCEKHQMFNYKVAVDSMVLLKNNGILPLKQAKKIAVIGPNADDVSAQYGDWTLFSHPDPNPNAIPKEGVYTILKGIQAVYSESEIIYAKGCTIDNAEETEESEHMIKEAINAAQKADAVVLVLGDNLSQNGETKDRANLVLSGRQTELIAKIHGLGKPVITVLVNGKPLVLTEAEKYSDAMIETFNGGDMCGLAAAKLLKGEENFSGKLPISFPYDSASGPCYYNQYGYWHGGKYMDVPEGSLYPFGYGLSYSHFQYGKPELSKTEAKKDEMVTVSAAVTNTGNVDGKEVIQLYFKDKVCKILTPVKTLLDYQKIELRAGETKIVEFNIETQKLGYYDSNCEYKVDKGVFIFYVSGDGIHFLETSLNII